MTWGLNAVSIIFKAISLLNLQRKALRREQYPEALVISVDNLSFGGTGKTTSVIEIGRFLEKKNLKFAVVTRGYRSALEHNGTVVRLHHTARDVGDEAALFKHRFPRQDIYVGKNRRRSLEKALADSNKIILLDDGFQTTQIEKDLKIMLVNPQHPYYYLRNFKFLMKKEDYVFFYRSAGSPPPGQPGGPVYGTYDFQPEHFGDAQGKTIEIADVRDAALLGFSALGDNTRFKEDLSAFRLVGYEGYRDHYAYTEADLQRLNRLRIQKNAHYLVCTEKDFIKIKRYNLTGIPLIYARNSIKFSLDLMGCILKYAEEKNKLEASI